MRLIFIISFFLLISNQIISQNNPKKIVLEYYSELPYKYISSSDEFTQLEISLFVREISINLLNKFLEDFSKYLIAYYTLNYHYQIGPFHRYKLD